MKRDFWGTAQNVAKPRRAVVRTAERASCGAVRCARTRSMVVYAVLARCSSSLCLLESLTQPVPIERRETQKRHAPCGGRPGIASCRGQLPSAKHPAPHTSLASARRRATRERTGASRRRYATPGIAHYSLLPAAHSFAALNLYTLHFSTIDRRSAAQHERPADRSRPKAGQRQRAGPSSRSLPGSRALAVAVARRCPRQRGRLPVPARADQATDARAVLLRRPLLSPATVLLLFLCVRREVRGGRRHETEAVHEGPGRQRVERTPELEDRGERYRRDIAPARHLTGR